jgi:SAM-dependent methyltransferase
MRAAWEQHAVAWTEWARAPGHDSYWRFGRDAFFALLPAPGRLTVDVGCGEGRLSRDLTALGHRVVSVDASMTMVRAAVAAAPGIPALVADAAALPVASGSCDLVIAYMSLQDIDDMQAAVIEMARVLQPGGHLCAAVVHPLNSAGTFESVEPDSPFVISGSYLEPHDYVDEIEREGLRMTFHSRHHSLEDYFGTIERAGLVVEAVREVPVSAASAAEKRDRERWRRLPLFLDLRATKPSRQP